jgi:ABC-type sugar transport system permease subunit
MEEQTKVAQPKVTTRKASKRKETWFLFCMLILPFVQWLVFWLYVNLQTIMLAFQDQRTEAFTFYNFQNFWQSLTTPGGDIAIAVKNTFIYFGVNICIVMTLALLISYFLYKQIRGYKTFRIIFYLPAIVSSVAMVAVFKNFINPRGPLNNILQLFGQSIPAEGLLADPSTATATIVCYCVWTGFCSNILLFAGAMTRVPIDVLESAKLEGCGTVRELFGLIFPLIWPTTSTQIIFAFTGIFSSSGPILLFTSGAYETTTISYWIFEQVYGTGAAGGAGSYNLVSAAGLCFTAVGVPIILFVRWLMERIPAVEY